MATGVTTNYFLPYPLSTDPVRVAGDIEQLAHKIDTVLEEEIQDTAAAIWTGGSFANGLNAPSYNDTTGKMSMSLAQDLQTTASPQFVDLTLTGDIEIRGGDIVTNQTTFNLVNSTATTLNIGGAATTISIGNSSGVINSSANLNLATEKAFYINGANVLSSTTLGSGVTSSSLTSVGTIASGTWQGSVISATYIDSAIARLDSPTLTGTPAGPTATADTNTTQLATTAFVLGQAGGATPLVNGTAAAGTSLRYARQDHVHGTDTTRAPLESPNFTGTPLAPTATAGTNTTQIATTQFVQFAISSSPYSLPSQTGNSGKFLTTDGTNASWTNIFDGGAP